MQSGASRATSAAGLGTALSLDGVDDYVSISADLLNNRSEGTVEALIWTESFVPNSSTPIISKGDNGLTQFALFVTADSISVHGGSGIDGFTVLASVALRTWTKVAVT